MKQIFAVTAVALMLSAPVVAQEGDTKEVDEGLSLMEEGAMMLLRGLMAEMEPAIEDLKDMGEEMSTFSTLMGPALAELMTRIDDIRNYDTPEILPNGDVIIRRNDDAPAYVPEADVDTGEVEL